MMKIELDSVKKVFKVTASGSITASDATAYKKEFEATLKKIQPSQYVLLIDAREQKAVHPDCGPLLETMLKLYVQTPFKKRITIVSGSAISNQQVKRHGKDEVQQFIQVTSLEEAYKHLK